MADITPITREEFYLAKAGGQDVPIPSAVTREEYYLEKLTNDSVAVPSPVTRREKFLYFASGGEIDLPSEEKMTRLERLIAKAGGMDVSTPTAITRLEKFWANVEGGGWKTITGVLPLTFTAKGSTAVDWVIYGNDENGTEQLFPFADIDFNYKYGQTDLHIWSDSGKLFMQGITYETSTTAQMWKDNLSFTLPAGTYACNTIATSQYGFTIGRYIKKKSDNSNILGADSTSFTIAEETEVYLSFYIFNATISTATQITVTLIVGSTAPDHYIPYRQGVGERTENLCDVSQSGMVQINVEGAMRYGLSFGELEVGDYTVVYTSRNTMYITKRLSNNTYSSSPAPSGTVVTITNNIDELIFRTTSSTETTWEAMGVSDIMLVKGSTPPETYIPYGYQIPLTVSQQGQPDKTYDIYIGDSPLTEGETVSKTSTGVDIELFSGENTVSTTLYNKPDMEIKYK